MVDGRRWRASDPAIPEPLRAELVEELMAARRAVAAARRAHSEEDEAAARRRVQHAKVALGERGEPWWEEPTPEGSRTRLESAVRALLATRGPDRSICPSDASRVAGGERWRSLMGPARQVARELASAGEVVVTQKGAELSPQDEWKGPVRIRLR